MPHPPTFEPLPPAGAVYYGSVPLNDKIVFFPTLQYESATVYPQWWHPESEEPILFCHMMQWEDCALSTEELRKEGWQIDDPREPARGYVHVDELEKIEGPPPEGPF